MKNCRRVSALAGELGIEICFLLNLSKQEWLGLAPRFTRAQPLLLSALVLDNPLQRDLRQVSADEQFLARP